VRPPIVASRTKLDDVRALRVDTDDPDLDAELAGWVRVRRQVRDADDENRLNRPSPSAKRKYTSPSTTAATAASGTTRTLPAPSAYSAPPRSTPATRTASRVTSIRIGSERSRAQVILVSNDEKSTAR